MKIYLAYMDGKKKLNIGETVNTWHDRYGPKERSAQTFIKEIEIGDFLPGEHTDTQIHKILKKMGAKSAADINAGESTEVFIVDTIAKEEEKAIQIVEYIISSLYLNRPDSKKIKEGRLRPIPEKLTNSIVADCLKIKSSELKTVNFNGREFNKKIVDEWLTTPANEIKGLFAYPRAGKSITTAYYFKKRGYKNIGIFSGKPSEIKDAWGELNKTFIDFMDMHFDMISLQKLGIDAERDEDRLFQVIKEVCKKNKYDAIAVDEFHYGMWHAKYTKALESLKIEVIIITGTPYVPSEIFKTIKEENIKVVSYAQLVESGICVPSQHFHLKPAEENITLENFDSENIGPFLDDLFNDQTDFYKNLDHGLIVVKNNNFAKAITAYISKKYPSIEAIQISGGLKITSSLEKKLNKHIEEVTEIRDGKMSYKKRVLFVTCNRGLCGISVPALNYLVWLTDQTEMSLNKFQQANARVTMVHGEKTYGRIFYLSLALAVKAVLEYKPTYGMSSQGLKQMYLNSDYEQAEYNTLHECAFGEYRLRNGAFVAVDGDFKDIAPQYIKQILGEEIFYEKIKFRLRPFIEKIDWSKISLDGKAVKAVLNKQVFKTESEVAKTAPTKKKGVNTQLDDNGNTTDKVNESEMQKREQWLLDMLVVRKVLGKDIVNILSNSLDESELSVIEEIFSTIELEANDIFYDENIESENFVKILFKYFLNSQARVYLPKEHVNTLFGEPEGAIGTLNLELYLHMKTVGQDVSLCNVDNVWTEDEKEILKKIYKTNIVEIGEKKMKKFDTVIMNPPYGKMHLPILAKLTEEVVDKHGGKIISLQPLRWLEDSLWKWKKNKPDAQKYRKTFEGKLEVLKEIPSMEANTYFKDAAGFVMNLAIFKVSRKSNFNYESYLINENHPMLKQAFKNPIKKHIKLYEEEKYFVPLKHITYVNRPTGYRLNKEQCYLIDGKTPNGTYWKDSLHKTPLEGVAFKTKEEMMDFYTYTNSNTMKKWLKIVIKDAHIPYQFIPYIFDGYENVKF